MHHLFSLPIFCFILGYFLKPISESFGVDRHLQSLKAKRWTPYLFALQSCVTQGLLFLIGLKGGLSLVQYSDFSLIGPLVCLMLIGFIQPFIGYFCLRKFTSLDAPTSAAVAASFGSISIMTFVSGIAFLEKLGVEHEVFLVAAAALMELPAIISGVLIFKYFHDQSTSWMHLLKEATWNPTIFLLLLGMLLGLLVSFSTFQLNAMYLVFKVFLCLFLLNMGSVVYQHKENLKKISYSLISFALYMPLLGACLSILVSYLFHLSPGSATLIALLMGSASYIAVPAAMRTLIPEAKEAVYVPLALAVTFPFNILIGIPLYYRLATLFLK